MSRCERVQHDVDLDLARGFYMWSEETGPRLLKELKNDLIGL